MPSLSLMFDSHYQVLLADTQAARAIHYKIRYHVYCLERRFENPALFPRGEEQDPWDAHTAPSKLWTARFPSEPVPNAHQSLQMYGA